MGKVLKSSCGGGGGGRKPQRFGTSFYGGIWLLETPSTDFHVAIGGGLVGMKLLKSGTGKGFIFHAINTAL